MAAQKGVNHSTVLRIAKKWRETGSFGDKPKSGRPLLFDDHLERKMVHLISSAEYATVVDIQSQLQTYKKLAVSAPTIRQAL